MLLVLPADMVALLAPFAPLFSRPVWRHVQTVLVARRGHPQPRPAHGQRCPAGRRAASRASLSGRPSRLASCSLVEPEGQPPLARPARGTVCSSWAAGAGHRGDDPGAAAASRARRLASRATPCARATAMSCRCVGGAGSASCCSCPCRGQRGCGPCPFSPCSPPSERAAQRQRRRYKSLTTWARQLMRQVPRWQPARALVVVGDRTSAARELLDAVRSVATVVTRLRLDAEDARLFAPPPPRLPHQKGRPRLVGSRLPNLTHHLQDAEAVWTVRTVFDWYGARDRPVEGLSQTAMWSSTGFPPVPIRSRAHPRSAGHLPHPSPAVHRPRRRAAAHPRLVRPLVRPSLAGRRDVPRSAHPSGRRDAARDGRSAPSCAPLLPCGVSSPW